MNSKQLQQKISVAQKTTKLLEFVPFIKMIAICNSVASGTAREDSDVDLLIIAKAKHIYTVRYFCVLLLTIFKLKALPEKNLLKNKVSLSFFLSNDFLNLDRINKDSIIKSKRAKWIVDLIALFSDEHEFLNFVDKNSWVKQYKKNYYTHMSEKNKFIKNHYLQFIFRKLLELLFFFGIGWLIEVIFRTIQVKKLYLYKHQNIGKEQMIINDHIIKLHCTKGKCQADLF